MKRMLLGIVLLLSATMFGQSPFDGTWMTKLDTAKFPTKPDKYSLSNNMYECLTCICHDGRLRCIDNSSHNI